MKKVHITLQGKGGVGKSLVASLLAQYHLEKDQSILCIDTDPINATLSGYAAFSAKYIRLMDGTRLDERQFDQMMESILENDAHHVIDNGASSFIPLSNYLIENNAIEMLQAARKQVVVHSVITGGQALLDTLNGFSQLAQQLPENVQIVVWLNEYFGQISLDSKHFEEMKAYTENKHRIHGLIRIPKQSSDTFGKDIAQMLDSKLTFADIDHHPDFGLMAKQRLSMVKKTLFDQMTCII
jgi:cellulose biosynthesis protein BcsQ